MGAAGILLPCLIAGAAVSAADDPEAYAKYFSAYVISYMSAWFTVALLAGNAVAGGRADRSAEFLAYLPLPRWRVLASKLVLPLITVTAAAGVNIVFVDLRIRPVEPVELSDLVDLRLFASVLLVVYCAGWLATQFLSSPLYAAVIGVLVPIGVGVKVVVMLDLSGADGNASLTEWLAVINISTAFVCFSLGTWVFLRRHEP